MYDTNCGSGIGASASSSPSRERLDSFFMSEQLSRALREGILDEMGEVVVFYDLSRLEASLINLKNAFPPTALHAIAVKANPAIEVLKRIQRAGFGCEVASWGELQIARAAGFAPEVIVFDSPAKTRNEIEQALRVGVRINVNTFAELNRIAGLFGSMGSSSQVGIRINPETGAGSIDTTSVATKNSKFGVSLGECRQDLIHAFAKHDWLRGVHVHIGSQGMSREQLLEGTGAVYDFFVEVNATTKANVFNFGGGLPAKYKESEASVDFEQYAKMLRQRCPMLFGPDICLVTEFGRAIHANCGWVVSRVEYVAEYGDDPPTAFIHVGADMFLRKAYRPGDWHHDISICDATGKLRIGPKKTFRVAGPLCFAGDYLDRNASLPEDTREGDYAVIHDAGAYTFSMWSLYNSRQFPAIIGYDKIGKHFHRLRPRQSVDEIVKFWSGS